MIRKFMTLFLGLLLFSVSGFAFDEQKAKIDYQGANFEVASVKESLYENAPAIAISFTAPLSAERIREHHAVLEGGGSDHWIISDDHTKLIFPFVLPETQYTVLVSSEIRDVNGKKLSDSLSRTIRTKALKPGVHFTSSAHILSSSSPKKLPVTTLNVDEVNIDFFAMESLKLPGLMDDLSRNGSHSYTYVDQVKDHGKMVYSGRFELKPRKNQRTEYNIDLDAIEELKPPGVYVAVMAVPGSYEYSYQYAYFMQTDIGMHIRKYGKNFDVYTQDIVSGQPLKSVKIDVIDDKGRVVDSGVSDENGRTGFPIQKGACLVLASQGDQVSFLRLNHDALDLSGLKNAVTTHSEYQIYAWGPRDLYRPGEEIKVNMLVRNYDGQLPPNLPLAYTLYKPDGSKVSSDQIQSSGTGFYTFKYQSSAGTTGDFHLKLSFAGTNSSSYYFKVEEFMPERLDLQLFDGPGFGKRLITAPDEIKVPVQSNYLYGAPASGNRVDGFVFASVDLHPFEKMPTFYFGDSHEKIENQRVEFGEINLSEEGKGDLSMANLWSKTGSPLKLNISASVYETGGRPVTRHTWLTMLSQDRYIGLEPQFKGNPDSNSTVDVKVVYFNSQGEWMANKRVDLTLIRQDRNWYWRNDYSRGWHWAWDETPVVVFSKNVLLDDLGSALVSLPLTWGDYRVEVRDKDILTAHEFQTSWSWWGNSSDSGGQKPDRISLGFEQSAYKPGDLVTLRINPPQDGLALITVESSEKVLFTKYMDVKSQGTVVDIPTDKSWDRHDIYTSVMVIRPGDLVKTPVPTRSFGMVHLPLKRENTSLTVELTAPEKVKPNQKVQARVKVSADYPLTPATKIVVALVDVGILNITRFKTPDAGAYFFGPRRYNLELMDNYGQIIDNLGPINARQRFGGGFRESDAELARGGNKPKSEVLMVSFFSDPLALDENGVANIAFDLPDFNGELRWMVLAFGGGQFGKTDADTRVADDVVTQIALPRFLARGDKSTMALDIRNMSGRDLTLNLDLAIDGALAPFSQGRQVSLKDGEKATPGFPLEAVKGFGQGEIRLHLYNQDREIDINRVWHLGVRSPYPSVTRSVRGLIKAGAGYTPGIKIDDLVPGSLQFSMGLSNRPPIDFKGHFKYLLEYPYGCLEQSVSSGYPWVLISVHLLNQMGLAHVVKDQFQLEYTDSFRRDQVDRAVKLILDRQKSSGGFGTWSSDSWENRWLSVYAAEFLNDAVKIGASVSPGALENANRRILKYLRERSSNNDNIWVDDYEHYGFAVRSYAGYVLARAGVVGLSDLRRLSEQFKEKTSDDGLSWMNLAAAFRLGGDAHNAEVCYGRAMVERKRARDKYYGDYGSPVRDLARIAELSMAHGFAPHAGVLFDLADAVKQRTWLSTQEQISLFRAAVLMEKSGEETWDASIITSSGTQNIQGRKTFNTLFDISKYKELERIQNFSQDLHFNLTVVGEPASPPVPVSNEMTIERVFYDTRGNELILDQMKTGELAVVKLSITSSKRTPDGLVVDLLPAGLELENQNLGLANINLDTIKISGKAIGELKSSENIIHEEFRDDRYVAAVAVNKNYAVNLFYLVRAVTPGVYKMAASYVEDMYRPSRFAIGATPGQLEVFE